MTLLMAILLGSALALLSLALLTPRRWWRRPTLALVSLLLLCSAAYAQVLLRYFAQPTMPERQIVQHAPSAPAAQYFRVQQALHLRASSATAAPQLALLPAQQIVLATGLRAGDWWQVCSAMGTGWVSSLWLRRLDEPAWPHLELSREKQISVGCAPRAPKPDKSVN